jgi:hypothetical protein
VFDKLQRIKSPAEIAIGTIFFRCTNLQNSVTAISNKIPKNKLQLKKTPFIKLTMKFNKKKKDKFYKHKKKLDKNIV